MIMNVDLRLGRTYECLEHCLLFVKFIVIKCLLSNVLFLTVTIHPDLELPSEEKLEGGMYFILDLHFFIHLVMVI